MSEPVVLKKPHSILGKMEMPYKTFVGTLASKFFIELRDNKKILGIRCPRCKLVYMPPRAVCGKCFAKLDEWVELSDKGTVLTYTVVNYKEPIQPMDPPFAYGIIQLNGANTGFLHCISGVDPKKLKIGMRVQAVFKEKREGNMLDIKYFQPL
jgi:hypothetical protein